MNALQDLFPSMNDRIAQMVNSALAPYCFIFAGASVAPSRKLVTAISLTALVVTAGAVITTLAVSTGNTGYNLGLLVVSDVVGLVACVVACEHIRKADRTQAVEETEGVEETEEVEEAQEYTPSPNAENARTYFERGKVRAARGDYEGAAEDWARAKELGWDFREHR